MIRIAVCDDDQTYLDLVLKDLFTKAVKKAQTAAHVDFFTDGRKLLKEFQNHRGYDIVILDIDMPSMNGKELAAQLRGLDRKFCLAFLTAYPNEALNTIPYSVKAFIPKDYSGEKVVESLAELLRRYTAENPAYTVYEISKIEGGGYIRLSFDEIFFFRNIDEHVYLNTADKAFLLTAKNFKQLEERYDLSDFFRIHTDLLVNLGKIYEITKTDILLTNGVSLPVSRRRYNELVMAFADFISIREGM